MLGLVCVGFIFALLVCLSISSAPIEPDLEVFPTDRMLKAGCSLAEFYCFCCSLLKKLASAWLARRRYKLTTSRRACRAPRATDSQSRLPVAVRAPAELGSAAALQATSARSQRR